jgi:hypothetical protein
MAESTFNLFGPITDKDLKVAYISTDKGYQGNVSVCDANAYAKANPGTVFIFKPDRETIQYLNINGVNKLAALEDKATSEESCPDGLNMNADPEEARAIFMGGGGVGVAANPVIGDDGAVLALDMVNSGFGYKYPPIVEVRDDTGIGAGAVVTVEVETVGETTKYYTDKEDFEEYEICPSPLPEDEYGKRYSPDGKEIGKWDPERYTGDKSVPFSEVVDEYLKKIEQSGKDWWTTRKDPPLAVTSDGGSTREKYDVQHWAWGGTATALTEVEFEIHWHSPHRSKGLGFEFTAQDGSHSFTIVDTSKKSDGSRKDVYKVKENTTYNIKTIGARPLNWNKSNKNERKVNELAEMGLLSTMKPWKNFKKVGADGEINKLKLDRAGEGDKIFADFLDTLDDSDDLQVRASQGKFTASNPREAQGLSRIRQTYDLTYRLQTGKKNVESSFMNTYAISPKPPSNVKGSDFAGKWFTFEWNVDFPYDGEYVFRGARDNKAFLWMDNQKIGSLEHLRGRKRIGTSTGKGFKRNIKKGNHTVRIDLLNEVVREKAIKQQPPAPSTKEVTFKISSAAQFANSFRIDGLNIFESKTFNGPQINAKITKEIEFGKKYKVVLESAQSTAGVKLRVKDGSILEMEEHTDEDWTDIICAASAGQFTNLNKNVAYFSVPYPPKKTGRSEGSEGTEVREVFNTVDYIDKANRQLWRTNIYARGGFINEYGICPFDTRQHLKDNPYAGVHRIVWPNVSFPIDGNYTIEVGVDDNVDLKIGDQVQLTKQGFSDGHSTGVLRTTRFIKQGNHNITADLHQIPGGAFSFKSRGKTKTNVKFNVNVGGMFGNQITIPGLFVLAKDYKGVGTSLNKEYEVEIGKEYDVVITSIRRRDGNAQADVRKGAIRFRSSQDKSGAVASTGPRLEYEDRLGTSTSQQDHGDIIARANQGRFYNVNGNRCKFMVGETIKGINPMSLAINIETEFAESEIAAVKSWNENPMGVAMTIEAPAPPIPQEPIPVAEGRCPNNPYWTTRFPGSKERWYPVRYPGWGPLLNDHAITPVLPFDKTNNPMVDVSFEVHWYSPHRSKGLGYEFLAEDGSHSFSIRDISKVNRGSRTETHKVKKDVTYNVKAIGKRAHSQGSKVGKRLNVANKGAFDNSKVIELAEQGLLSKLGPGNKVKEWRNQILDTDQVGTGDKIFADFLDTLADSDDLQIQAKTGKFTASNPKLVESLQGKRKTFDLTFKVGDSDPRSGPFTNTWTKSFEFGG